MKKILKKVKNTVSAAGVAVYAMLIIVVGNILFKICYVADFIRGKNPTDRVKRATSFIKERCTDEDAANALATTLFWPIKI